MPINVAINGFVTDDLVACFQGHNPTDLFGGKLVSEAFKYRFFECPLEFIGFSFRRCFTELLSAGGLIGLVGIGLTITS